MPYTVNESEGAGGANTRVSKASKQVKPLVYNQCCILLASPGQPAEKIGIRSFKLMDLERGRAVELCLWWTAGFAAFYPQAVSPFAALCPKAEVDVYCLAQVPPPSCARPEG